jgi:acyl phosphate:glycerol-3-phosphate acyltransferase
MYILWLLLCYLSGALPWSVWLGQLFFRVDPRTQRDRNPGAANAFRAAGWRLGVAVLVLDFLKAFLPVAAARWVVGFPAYLLLWLAVVPTIGHAFSVFLRFRGGRGIVVMFGVWAGGGPDTLPDSHGDGPYGTGGPRPVAAG